MLKKLLSTQTLYNPVTDSVSLSIKKMLHKASWETVITLNTLLQVQIYLSNLATSTIYSKKNWPN